MVKSLERKGVTFSSSAKSICDTRIEATVCWLYEYATPQHRAVETWTNSRSATIRSKILCTQLEIYKTPSSYIQKINFFLLKTQNKTPSKTRLGNKLVTAQARQELHCEYTSWLTLATHRLCTECRNAPPVLHYGSTPSYINGDRTEIFSIFTLIHSSSPQLRTQRNACSGYLFPPPLYNII
jgi:hypothetical protein